jgi:hypothetical protein
MNRRAVAAASVVMLAGLAGLASPGYATTKPKPSCRMLTDPAGDAKLVAAGSNYATDDVVSADIATGKKTLTAVLRMSSGDTSTGFPTGSTYELQWVQTRGGSGAKTMPTRAAWYFYLYATGGYSASYGASSNPDVLPAPSMPVTQAFMDRNGVITWVMPRKDASVSPGMTFAQLSVTTSGGINYQVPRGGGHSNMAPLDTATGHGSYIDARPSCVRAG